MDSWLVFWIILLEREEAKEEALFLMEEMGILEAREDALFLMEDMGTLEAILETAEMAPKKPPDCEGG